MIMTYTDLYMQFKFGIYNGSMFMDIYQDQELVKSFSDVNEELVIFEHSLRMGSELNIKLFNKFSRDTKVEDGKIVADKFIQLKEMRLGKIPILEPILFKICNYHVNDQTMFDTYWAFNGQVSISFAEENFIKWHLAHRNMFDF